MSRPQTHQMLADEDAMNMIVASNTAHSGMNISEADMHTTLGV